MKSIEPIARRLGSAEGAEILEAALVLPLLFMFLLGIVWFGRAFNIYSTIQQAAQQGAIVAARSTSCVTCGDGQATPTTVDNAIIAVMQASSLDPSQIQLPAMPAQSACPPPWPPGGCAPTPKNVYVCSNVQLTGATQPTQCGTVVSFQYPFQFSLPFTSLSMQTIVMSAQAQSRMEN